MPTTEAQAKPNVVSFTQAAEEKDCGRTTLYRARDRGELNVVQVGSRGMILRDDTFENWQAKGPGRPRQQSSDE